MRVLVGTRDILDGVADENCSGSRFEAERFPELFENVARHSDGEWWEV
jgi:hypothetical protein